MTFKSALITLIAIAGGASATSAANVTVTMNNVSKTMSLVSKTTGEAVETGTPAGTVYDFETPAGDYLLTAYATDGKTVNGTIELTVNDNGAQDFKIITCTAYATNSGWTTANGDYSLDVKVNSREGESKKITVGNSITANRHTFLALSGNSYQASFIPGERHRDEGFVTLYKTGTLTSSINISGAIPQAENFTITVPENAWFELGMKFSHFVDFTKVDPVKTEISGGNKSLTYNLAKGQIYNYRTSIKGGLTQAGYFTMNADESKRPVIRFSRQDYEAFSPRTINHDVHSNQGYETGDIFVNINPRGHLELKQGETFKAHAMRSWELTDNSTGNYFMEPDFHYTVIDLQGKPSENVISVSQAEGSSWADIKAVGKGTAIVLVTYDAIGVNYYSNATKSPYMGGEYWGAIWPENTAAYVITVGEGSSSVKPNMLINEKYNKETLKLSGADVDAEHDVFYYLDTEEGASYTFRPEGAANVTIAYPSIGAQMATYNGFTTDGVTRNADGSYTLLLKEGRQIVRLTDASGKSAYQVLTAKKCHRDIINLTREGSSIFQPGDQVKIQYSGLRHPANKLAGIYNMSAYVTYNGVPNGSSLILGSGQYTFGSAASAQAITVTIPESHDVAGEPSINMTEGVIQVNGFGDPIGNHRTIDPVAGRSPNFTATAHKTYFGMIPDVTIKLTAVRNFEIRIDCDVEDADITLSLNGKALQPDENGLYSGTYGTYSLRAAKAGYRCYHADYTIGDDAEGLQTFSVEMTKSENIWDGKTMTEPESKEGVYQIADAANLAWFANNVNTKGGINNAVLLNDIDLGDFEWTAIGNTSSKPFSGVFTGCNHRVGGLFINDPNNDNRGLFGYARGTASSPSAITGVTVDGKVSGKRYVGGVLGYANAYVTVDTCANYAEITGTGASVGGIAGYIGATTSRVANCYNAGKIDSPDIHAGIVGNIANNCDNIENVFNVGEISENTNASAIVGSTLSKTNVRNAFAVKDYAEPNGYTLVTEMQMESGEIAYRLGNAFGQKIGEDPYPVFGAPELKFDAENNRYYNDSDSGVETNRYDGLTPVLYYNLQGVASQSPYEGLNIVRMSDGSYRKMIIK